MKAIRSVMSLAVSFACFFSVLCGSAQAKDVFLWEIEGNVVIGSLPEKWLPMDSEELRKFSEKSAGLFQIPGDLVAGFRLLSEDSAANTPYIVVFANKGERVSLEEMQKTYSWFKKNSDFAFSVLPSNVRRVVIEDIEYLQKKFSILFQVRIETEHDVFTNMSSVIFLRNGYLNIACYATEEEFPGYADDFRTLIRRTSVPPTLLYQQADAGVMHLQIPPWISEHGQKIFGIVLLLSVYGFVFLRRKKQYGRRPTNKVNQPT